MVEINLKAVFSRTIADTSGVFWYFQVEVAFQVATYIIESKSAVIKVNKITMFELGFVSVTRVAKTFKFYFIFISVVMEISTFINITITLNKRKIKSVVNAFTSQL